MREIEGIVTIVQEGRFQLQDNAGVAHHFVLSHRAASEPAQLAPLQQAQSRVRVRYRSVPGLIGHVAERIDVLAEA